MTTRQSKQPLLRLHFEGSAIHDGRILLDDLLQFVVNLNAAIERTINVLQTGTSVRIGRPDKAFQLLSALEIVAVIRGSFDLALDLRREGQQILPGLDFGMQAVEKLMCGLNTMTPYATLPDGFDQGVLMALREAGRVLDRGIETVQISTRRRMKYREAVYAQTTRETIISTIRRLEQAWTTVEGRLLMADVREGALRCRLHPSTGGAVSCNFDEVLTKQVMDNLRNFVQARGDAFLDPVTNNIRSLYIRDLEPIEELTGLEVPSASVSAFWEAKDFDELAIEQGIHPIDDLETIAGGFPEDTDFEEFLNAVRSTR